LHPWQVDEKMKNFIENLSFILLTAGLLSYLIACEKFDSDIDQTGCLYTETSSGDRTYLECLALTSYNGQYQDSIGFLFRPMGCEECEFLISGDTIN